ncbi:MAG: hypothetical protein JNL74_21475 [Fibrobacteres bacterium]|nr:hypothetical protein [Fibrobacterota bacterium]
MHTSLYSKRLGNSLIIRLSGNNEQDLINLAALDTSKFSTDGVGHLAISLERVAFFYSATINRLVELYKILSEKSITLSLLQVPDKVRMILTGVKLDRHLNIYRSEYDFILAHNKISDISSGTETPQEMSEFGIHRECDAIPGVCRFSICGALIESHHAHQLYELIETAISEGIKEINIDLKKTTYID